MNIIKRVDTNQSVIVEGLREFGCTVQHLHEIGHGCPDILVGYNGKNFLMEIKRDAKAKLTEHEMKWLQYWKGKVAIITSIEEAIKHVNDDYIFIAGIDEEDENEHH